LFMAILADASLLIHAIFVATQERWDLNEKFLQCLWNYMGLFGLYYEYQLIRVSYNAQQKFHENGDIF